MRNRRQPVRRTRQARTREYNAGGERVVRRAFGGSAPAGGKRTDRALERNHLNVERTTACRRPSVLFSRACERQRRLSQPLSVRSHPGLRRARCTRPALPYGAPGATPIRREASCCVVMEWAHARARVTHVWREGRGAETRTSTAVSGVRAASITTHVCGGLSVQRRSHVARSSPPPDRARHVNSGRRGHRKHPLSAVTAAPPIFCPE